MGKCRFLYNNYISSSTAVTTASSITDGVITVALKRGTGSATLTPGGTFTGTIDLEYTVEIDGVGGGKEVGQSTFKWSDGGGVWDATGVTTDTDPITLNNGVTVAFTSGSGDDFILGDKWYFKAFNLFKVENLCDWNRDRVYRSGALQTPNYISFDLGASLPVQALCLWDHNLTGAAAITLIGDTLTMVGSPADPDTKAFHVHLSYTAERLLYYLTATQTYRYWQIQITDAANSDSCIEIGELYLGPYLELSKTYKPGFDTSWDVLQDINRTPYDAQTQRVYNVQGTFRRTFDPITSADVTNCQTMLSAIADRDTGRNQPLYFNEDSATPSSSYIVRLNGINPVHKSGTAYGITLDMIEVVPSV